jgi:hypothetical protein
LGIVAVVAVRGADGTRFIAAANGEDMVRASGASVEAQWWCRRATDAAGVAAAANARLRRQSKDDSSKAARASGSLRDTSSALSPTENAVRAAAKHCQVTLHSHEEVSAAAMAVIARVDEEIHRLQQAGELKSVNRSYRIYRTEAAGSGEKILRYAEWINKYKEKLVRELAIALRSH